MSDVNKVVDLRIFPNGCIAKRTAIDTAVSADGNIVLNNNPAQLRNIHDARIASRGTKAGFANHDPGLKPHPVADQSKSHHGPRAN